MEEVAGLVWDGNEEDYTGVSTCSPQRPPCISSFLLALPGLMCHTLGSPGSGLSLLLFLLGLCRKTLYPELPLPLQITRTPSAVRGLFAPSWALSSVHLSTHLDSPFILSYLPALLLCFSVAQISLSRMQSSLQSRLFIPSRPIQDTS